MRTTRDRLEEPLACVELLKILEVRYSYIDHPKSSKTSQLASVA